MQAPILLWTSILPTLIYQGLDHFYRHPRAGEHPAARSPLKWDYSGTGKIAGQK